MNGEQWESLTARAIVAAPRGSGQTTATAAAAKACGGVVLAGTAMEAARIASEHGCDAVSVRQADRLVGQRRPWLWDGHAVHEIATMLRAEERKTGELRSRLDATEHERDRERERAYMADRRHAEAVARWQDERRRLWAFVAAALERDRLGLRWGPSDPGFAAMDERDAATTAYDAARAALPEPPGVGE